MSSFTLKDQILSEGGRKPYFDQRKRMKSVYVYIFALLLILAGFWGTYQYVETGEAEKKGEEERILIWNKTATPSTLIPTIDKMVIRHNKTPGNIRISSKDTKARASLMRNAAYMVVDHNKLPFIYGNEISIAVDISGIDPSPGQKIGLRYYAHDGADTKWKFFPLRKGRHTYTMTLNVPSPPKKKPRFHYLNIRVNKGGGGNDIIVHSAAVYLSQDSFYESQ